MRLAIFAASFLLGIGIAWWWLRRPETLDEADEMCPNCVTPWRCNGPHEFGDPYLDDLAAILERERW